MVIYQNKSKPWKHACTRVYNYEKKFFFNFKMMNGNKWLMKPRFHARINLFFVSFWRDNCNFRIGLGLGKKQYSLNVHS